MKTRLKGGMNPKNTATNTTTNEHILFQMQHRHFNKPKKRVALSAPIRRFFPFFILLCALKKFFYTHLMNFPSVLKEKCKECKPAKKQAADILTLTHSTQRNAIEKRCI